jgi:luciferase family oxidoreductase group 1
MTAYRLSVLDQSPVAAGETASDALAKTLDLARLVDRLGYHRLWLAEHHCTPAVAGVAPEVLIGPVALATERIRVGSGGVLLPHYAPFKIAEVFTLLAALAPDRIDLGLGRAPGGNQQILAALQRPGGSAAAAPAMPPDFEVQLEQLIDFLSGRFQPDHPCFRLEQTLPRGEGDGPQVWVLGSSPTSAEAAARRGLAYCYADFLNPSMGEAGAAYRQAFRPASANGRPQFMVATWAIAADDPVRASHLAAPLFKLFGARSAEDAVRVASVDDAVAWLMSQPSPPGNPRRLTAGSPRQVREKLDRIAADYGADELMLVDLIPDHQARRRSYELLAEEYGLDAAGEIARSCAVGTG